MAVTIKSPREIELMRKAGEILAKTHEELHAALRPGMSTLDIDRLGEKIVHREFLCLLSRVETYQSHTHPQVFLLSVYNTYRTRPLQS